MKKILITGGNGYLGSHLISSLINEFELYVLVRSTSDLTRLNEYLINLNIVNADKVVMKDFIVKLRPEIVIHCATNYGKKNNSISDILDSNFSLPITILESLKEDSIFINTDTFLNKNTNNYSLSKKQFLDWFKLYKSRIVCINLVLEHFYGEKRNNDNFISYLIAQLNNKVEKIDLTKGDQQRSFIHIDDLTSAILLILKKCQSFRNGFYEFKIASSQKITIKELVILIKKLTENTNTILNFGSIDYRKNEIMHSSMNTNKLKKLGWIEKNSLESSLLKIIK